MKARWVLLEKGEHARKGDKHFDWNSNEFYVDDEGDGPGTDPFIVKTGEHVLRKVVIPVKHLRGARLLFKKR